MAAEDLGQMTLGLSHSLGRYKLKFSPDKVDVMIVQAIGTIVERILNVIVYCFNYLGLMDDLDKEINNYAMRVKEWYGWHFPELARLVPDNVLYARICRHLRQRSNIKNVDLSDILDEETEKIVTKAATLSMGTDVTDEDIEHLVELADQVIELFHYRFVLSLFCLLNFSVFSH
jgi:nucleolar protein 58